MASGSRVVAPTDRKSTRLNSSHLGISYAVFSLKKKLRFGRHLGGPTKSHDVRSTLLLPTNATSIWGTCSCKIQCWFFSINNMDYQMFFLINRHTPISTLFPSTTPSR